MKSINVFILSILLLFLLANSSVIAHGDEDGMGSSHMGTGHMMDMDHDGFEGYTSHMTIKGNIQITDSVKLSISAEPNEEMNNMMKDHMGSESEMMMYSNMMTISLTKLVEFIDQTNNGYSDDDVLVSQFSLNQVTMNPVELITDPEISRYIINSKSNVINITVEILSENGNPYAFKWSLDINYPFVQSNTSVAVLHELEMPLMSDMMTDETMMDDHNFDSHMMTDNNEHLPMFFSWDLLYSVDGETQEVISNLENNIFSLTFNQGSKIIYDPQIGFNPQDIQTVDNLLSNMGVEQFWETVKSPTSIGIVLGALSLGLLFIGFRIVNKSKN